MTKNPLAEVFGFPTSNHSKAAERYRKHRLCPYNNRVPSCTKDKANDPLGVCAIFEGQETVIVCPVRFRQDWLIAEDAARFFFPKNATWTSLTEVRLNDRNGKSAGNIDVVLVSYDKTGKVIDFASLEVQAVYISGNIRKPFEHFTKRPGTNLDWSQGPHYPRPDYLSSSRKRLVPQLIYKGGILKMWGKKMAVAIDQSFYSTLPEMPTAPPDKADIAWLIYRLRRDKQRNEFRLILGKTVYTRFEPALNKITTSEAGPVKDFTDLIQEKLDEKLENKNPPDAPPLDEIILT